MKKHLPLRETARTANPAHTTHRPAQPIHPADPKALAFDAPVSYPQHPEPTQQAEPFQLKWIPGPREDSPLRWDTLRSGLRWYQFPGTTRMYFEIEDATAAPAELAVLAGQAKARDFRDWLHLWESQEWITHQQAQNRAAAATVTGTDFPDYDDDDRTALADYMDTLPDDRAATYMQENLGPIDVPPHLDELTRTVPDLQIRRASSRNMLPARQRALTKIRTATSGHSARQVLVVGAAKDFVFPLLITGGQSQWYHMASAEVGTEETLRKTIAHYCGKNPAISRIAGNEYARTFEVRIDGRSFWVTYYDMSYEDFFECQQAGLIPAEFDLVIDQMSWIEQTDEEVNRPWASYIESVAERGHMVADHRYAGGLAEFLAMLGMREIPVDFRTDIRSGSASAATATTTTAAASASSTNDAKSTESQDENYGYGYARVYTKLAKLGPLGQVIALAYTRIHSSIKNFTSADLQHMDPYSAQRVRDGLQTILDAATGTNREIAAAATYLLTRLPATVVEAEEEDDDDATAAVAPAAPDTMTVAKGSVMGMFQLLSAADMRAAIAMELAVDTDLKHRASGQMYVISAVDKTAGTYTFRKK